MSNVYRVEVGGATYWMKLDEASVGEIMEALAEVGDESPASDIGEVVPLTNEQLDRRAMGDDGETHSFREMADAVTAPCAFGCSEWS